MYEPLFGGPARRLAGGASAWSVCLYWACRLLAALIRFAQYSPTEDRARRCRCARPPRVRPPIRRPVPGRPAGHRGGGGGHAGQPSHRAYRGSPARAGLVGRRDAGCTRPPISPTRAAAPRKRDYAEDVPDHRRWPQLQRRRRGSHRPGAASGGAPRAGGRAGRGARRPAGRVPPPAAARRRRWRTPDQAPWSRRSPAWSTRSTCGRAGGAAGRQARHHRGDEDEDLRDRQVGRHRHHHRRQGPTTVSRPARCC